MKTIIQAVLATTLFAAAAGAQEASADIKGMLSGLSQDNKTTFAVRAAPTGIQKLSLLAKVLNKAKLPGECVAANVKFTPGDMRDYLAVTVAQGDKTVSQAYSGFLSIREIVTENETVQIFTATSYGEGMLELKANAKGEVLSLVLLDHWYNPVLECK